MIIEFSRAGQTTTLPRQPDLDFRPQLLVTIALLLYSLWLLHLDTDNLLTILIFSCPSSIVAQNTLNLDPDPGCWPNLDPDPDPGLKYQF